MDRSFDVVGKIDQIQVIAVGRKIRELERLKRIYGPGRWKKLKGFATVRLPDGKTPPRRGTLVRGAWSWPCRTEDQETDRTHQVKKTRNGSRYFLCIKNRGFRVSLVVRRAYRVLPDAAAEKHGLLRVIDESGEDYLYPESFFVALDLPQSAQKALAQTT